MGEVFVSLIGTNVMGTQQAWAAFAEIGTGAPVYLLYTSETRKMAEEFRDYIEKSGAGGPVSIREVGFKLFGPESAPEIALKIAEEAQSQGNRLCFNINGGMNYMINACVIALTPYQPVLIAPTKWRIFRHDMKTKSYEFIKMPEPLPVEEILKAQGVSFHVIDNNPEAASIYPFADFCKEYPRVLPKNHLRNVCIDNIVFDLVWNPGNNLLRFFKDCRFYADNITSRDRNLAAWAKDRERCGDLYDKDITVFVAGDKSFERLNENSTGKLNVVRIADNEMLKVSYAEKLENLFSRSAKQGKEGILKEPEASTLPPMEDDTLVVVLGDNVDPTFTAIVSHHPRHLVLCHTSKNNYIRETALRIKEMGAELGLESVDLVEVGIDGFFLDKLLAAADKGKNIQVNVSPGTKLLGAMLTIWACGRGIGIWSMDRDRRKCVCLNHPDRQAYPMLTCAPDLYCRLKGMNLVIPEDGIQDEAKLAPELAKYCELLEFMRLLLAEGKAGYFMVSSDLRAGPYHLQKMKYNNWRLLKKEKSILELAPQGKWLEKLTAAALRDAGAHHVLLNPTFLWSSETEKRILMKHDQYKRPHRLELDVVGSYQDDYVFISCKSNASETGEDMEAAAKEAEDTGGTFGRFCLKMLCHINCGKPRIYNNSVMIIGWRELCQPQILREKIGELRRLKRKTSRG